MSACTILRLGVQHERQQLASKTSQFADNVITGQLTTNIVPVELLKHLMTASNLFTDTLLETNPLYFYRAATFSVLDVDVEKRKVRLLFGIPRISKEPEFVRINVLSPSTAITMNGRLVETEVKFPTDLYLPFNLTKSDKFSISNLTDSQVKSLKRLTDCDSFIDKMFCKTVLEPEESELRCLKNMLQGRAIDDFCNVRHTAVEIAPLATYDKGQSGLVLSAPSEPTIFGTDTDGKKERLTLAKEDAKHGICIYVPDRFETIEVIGRDRKVTIRQKYDIRLNLDRKVASTEAKWYETEIEKWHLETNISSQIPKAMLRDMVRKEVPKAFMHEHSGLLSLISLALVAVILIILKVWSNRSCIPIVPPE